VKISLANRRALLDKDSRLLDERRNALSEAIRRLIGDVRREVGA